MITARTITGTITVREAETCGKLKRVKSLLEWRNWQTHGTQNPASFTGYEGSTPSSSTKWVFFFELRHHAPPDGLRSVGDAAVEGFVRSNPLGARWLEKQRDLHRSDRGTANYPK